MRNVDTLDPFGASRPPGKLNIKTGSPSADIYMFSILLICSRLLFFAFCLVFSLFFFARVDIHDIRIQYHFLTFLLLIVG